MLAICLSATYHALYSVDKRRSRTVDCFIGGSTRLPQKFSMKKYTAIYETIFMYHVSRSMETTLDVEKLEKVAFILKTIAHPMRIGIIELLTKHDELSVNEIVEKLGTEQSLTSHHLLNMKLKGVLSNRREGKNIFYALRLKEVTKVIECMEQCQNIPF